MKKQYGTLRPVQDRVIVKDMHFGERKTAGGHIIRSDDGKDYGIRPRWGKVYAKGPMNKDEYQVGDWVLVEHGRWTRGVDFVDDDGEEITLRMVEAQSILMMQPGGTCPEELSLGEDLIAKNRNPGEGFIKPTRYLPGEPGYIAEMNGEL